MSSGIGAVSLCVEVIVVSIRKISREIKHEVIIPAKNIVLRLWLPADAWISSGNVKQFKPAYSSDQNTVAVILCGLIVFNGVFAICGKCGSAVVVKSMMIISTM